MEMDGTYDHNIQITLTFTYGAVPESIWNHHACNGASRAIRENALKWYNNPLDACVLAGGLNCELLSPLTFHLNKYMCSKHGKNENFAWYKWCIISIVEIYHLLGI